MNNLFADPFLAFPNKHYPPYPPCVDMKLGEELLKLLNKKYEGSTTIDTEFRRYDITFRTDQAGNPVLLFIGRRNEKGIVVGDRFSRTLKYDGQGNVIKDHWERKGPAR